VDIESEHVNQINITVEPTTVTLTNEHQTCKHVTLVFVQKTICVRLPIMESLTMQYPV